MSTSGYIRGTNEVSANKIASVIWWKWFTIISTLMNIFNREMWEL